MASFYKYSDNEHNPWCLFNFNPLCHRQHNLRTEDSVTLILARGIQCKLYQLSTTNKCYNQSQSITINHNHNEVFV